MPNRRADRNPNGPERRRAYRREEDDETHEIVEHAVDDAPIVHGLLKTGRVAAAVGAACGLLGTASGALVTYGQNRATTASIRSEMTARIDSNTARIRVDRAKLDEVIAVALEIKSDISTLKLVQCQTLRRVAPDLRPDGCAK